MRMLVVPDTFPTRRARLLLNILQIRPDRHSDRLLCPPPRSVHAALNFHRAFVQPSLCLSKFIENICVLTRSSAYIRISTRIDSRWTFTLLELQKKETNWRHFELSRDMKRIQSTQILFSWVPSSAEGGWGVSRRGHSTTAAVSYCCC